MQHRGASQIAFVGFALAAISLVIVRACLQSVVIDEADCWLLFAGKSDPSMAWWPSSGNHILNTLLIRLSTAVFGLNELTLRLPAICGAAIYIGSACYACQRLASLPLFLCMVYNPLVLDYLVAARGYSLALGFFMAALAVMLDAVLDGRQQEITVSVLLALSFCANFSFGIADFVTLLAYCFWAWRRERSAAAIAGAILPAAAVVFCLCGYTLWHWPKGQLFYGAHSLYETARGLIHSSYFELNPNVVNPWLKFVLERVIHFLWPAALILVVTLLGLTITRRLWTPPVAILLGVTACTVLVHWLAFHLFGLPLPKGRTALFFVPLAMLLFGTLVQAMARRLGAVLLTLSALCFFGCLRLSYFEEWKFDADTKKLYWTLAYLQNHCEVHRYEVEWYYTGALNFYREVNRDSSLPQFRAYGDKTPVDGDVYVLNHEDEKEFIAQQKLRVIYRGAATQATIAVRDGACAKIEVP